jgi:uncharacterized protein DUF3551
MTSRPHRIARSLAVAITLGATLALLSPSPAARADWRQAAPWCANMGGGWGFDCSYYSLKQCLVTARGLGGSCSPNPRLGWHERRGHRSDRW